MHLLNRMATTSAYPKLPACLPHPPRSHDMAFAGRQQCKWREGVICNLYFLVNKIENLESTVEQKTKKKQNKTNFYTAIQRLWIWTWILLFLYSTTFLLHAASSWLGQCVIALLWLPQNFASWAYSPELGNNQQHRSRELCAALARLIHDENGWCVMFTLLPLCQRDPLWVLVLMFCHPSSHFHSQQWCMGMSAIRSHIAWFVDAKQTVSYLYACSFMHFFLPFLNCFPLCAAIKYNCMGKMISSKCVCKDVDDKHFCCYSKCAVFLNINIYHREGLICHFDSITEQIKLKTE